MFDPPSKLKHITKHFQTLCDAAMDLDPQPIMIVLAEAAVIRECTNAAEELTDVDPIDIPFIINQHHRKISNYLFICSLLLDTDLPDSSEDPDLKIF
jgi:hypothetical protein